jgi:hypothetical protein
MADLTINKSFRLNLTVLATIILTSCTIYLPPIPYLPKKPAYYKEYKKNRSFIGNRLKPGAKSADCAGFKGKYALLINSDTSSQHTSNMHLAYETLTRLGFKEQNIIVLKCTPFLKYKDSYPYYFTSSALRSNLDKVFRYYRLQLNENDILLVYVTGHGYRKDYESWFLLEDKSISSSEYSKDMQRIKASTIISIFDPCYSGGFAFTMRSNHKAITITDTDGGNQTDCKYFTETFWGAFFNLDNDLNHDGKVSLKEAYDVAIKEHKAHLKKSLSQGLFCAPKSKPDVVIY